MMGEINPYEAPRAGTGSLNFGDAEVLPQSYVAWCVLFGFNLIVPGFLGWVMTSAHGRLGMLVAIALLLVIGLYTCSFGRKVAHSLNLGAAVVATTQVFPVLQMVAGLIGFAASGFLGQVVYDEFHPPEVISNLGGFVATLVTGGILMGVNYGLGAAIRSFLAK